jgi:ribosomal protein L37AE/L43A
LGVFPPLLKIGDGEMSWKMCWVCRECRRVIHLEDRPEDWLCKKCREKEEKGEKRKMKEVRKFVPIEVFMEMAESAEESWVKELMEKARRMIQNGTGSITGVDPVQGRYAIELSAKRKLIEGR